MTTQESAVLAAIEAEPGITMSQIVRVTGLREGLVWSAMSSLTQQGKIKNHDHGWKVSG